MPIWPPYVHPFPGMEPASSGIHPQDLPLFLQLPEAPWQKMMPSLYGWLANSPTHQPVLFRATIIFVTDTGKGVGMRPN
jgi:hypothetical protein